jgi:hypothetical protein
MGVGVRYKLEFVPGGRLEKLANTETGFDACQHLAPERSRRSSYPGIRAVRPLLEAPVPCTFSCLMTLCTTWYKSSIWQGPKF